LTVHLH